MSKSHLSKRHPIVFIHGMWSTSSVWNKYVEFYQDKGYEVHTPVLRHHEPDEQDLETLGGTGIAEYLDDLTTFIESLEKKPILIGHSLGGLLALILAGRGLAEKAVLLAPITPAGYSTLYPSVMKTFVPALLRRGFWKQPVKLSSEVANDGLFNRLPDEAKPAHYQEMVYESGRTISEIMFWFMDNDQTTRAVKVPDNRLLIMAGKHDQITPAERCRKVAQDYGADFMQLEEHGHWLPSEPGWERIAEQSEIWLSLDG